MPPVPAIPPPQTYPTLRAQSANVLLLASEATTPQLARILSGSYRVVISSDAGAARVFLGRDRVSVVVTEIELRDSEGIDLCREAKRLPQPPAVLVVTQRVETVPDALEAGCDSVLLQPFAPNLLAARMGRLVSARAQHSAASPTSDGTNRFWPATACPYCDTRGVTSFEFTSHRRAWYACGRCKKVWIGKRQE